MRYGFSSSTTCGKDLPRVRRVIIRIRALNLASAFGAMRERNPQLPGSSPCARAHCSIWLCDEPRRCRIAPTLYGKKSTCGVVTDIGRRVRNLGPELVGKTSCHQMDIIGIDTIGDRCGDVLGRSEYILGYRRRGRLGSVLQVDEVVLHSEGNVSRHHVLK